MTTIRSTSSKLVVGSQYHSTRILVPNFTALPSGFKKNAGRGIIAKQPCASKNNAKKRAPGGQQTEAPDRRVLERKLRGALKFLEFRMGERHPRFPDRVCALCFRPN